MNSIGLKNISYSSTGHQLSGIYTGIQRNYEDATLKDAFLDSAYDGLKESPLTTEDEKWIAKLARLKDVDGPLLSNSSESLKAKEIYLEEFFSEDAKEGPLDKRIAEVTAKAAKSLDNPESQLKVLQKGLLHLNNMSYKEGVKDKFAESTHDIAYFSHCDTLGVPVEDGLAIAFKAMENIGTPGPIPKVMAKFYTEAIDAVSNPAVKRSLLNSAIAKHSSRCTLYDKYETPQTAKNLADFSRKFMLDDSLDDKEVVKLGTSIFDTIKKEL